ncbi:unnamed protein product [Protopolystoma xenopodis]|uniref:Uncharacterized protein n=1 Tax=Protopolystoma xenopodis TaxID=117903 RepID=A0A3S5BEL0_9PLAT|nr:unnamed protein product [Protopolystoma xenopodis]
MSTSSAYVECWAEQTPGYRDNWPYVCRLLSSLQGCLSASPLPPRRLLKLAKVGARKTASPVPCAFGHVLTHNLLVWVVVVVGRFGEGVNRRKQSSWKTRYRVGRMGNLSQKRYPGLCGKLGIWCVAPQDRAIATLIPTPLGCTPRPGTAGQDGVVVPSESDKSEKEMIYAQIAGSYFERSDGMAANCAIKNRGRRSLDWGKSASKQSAGSLPAPWAGWKHCQLGQLGSSGRYAAPAPSRLGFFAWSRTFELVSALNF